MRTRLTSLVAAVALLVALAAPAAAILNGTPDGNRHPAVGGLVTQVPTSSGPVNVLICSGTMVSPTVFVTAAHCTDLLDELDLPAFVTLDSVFDYQSPDTLFAGQQYTHPQFGVSFPDTYDVGVVVLGGTGVTSVLGAAFDYPDLAPLGYLDALAKQRGQKDMTFTVVGYGSYGFATKGVNYEPLYDDIRRFAPVQFLNINGGYADGWNLKHSGNPGNGRGSSCHGDSGGPVMQGNVVVAITSFGIANQCAGPGYAFRADIAVTHEFVGQFLP